MTAPTVTSTPVGDLRPHPDNARQHAEHVLDESLATLGQYRPIVANRRNRRILAGHGLWNAARRAGWPAVQVAWVDVDEDTERRILLVDNRASDLSGYDQTALHELLQEVARTADGLTATGWTSEQLDEELAAAELAARQAAVDLPPDVDETAPAPPEDPITRPGDLWQLGRHRVLCGDATNPTDAQRLLDGTPADVMWTDPPYGVDYVGGDTTTSRQQRLAQGGQTVSNDTPEQLAKLLAEAFSTATTALRPGAPVYIAHAASRAVTFTNAFETAGWHLHQTLIWAKDRIVPGRSDYHYQHEPILYGYTAGSTGRRGRGGPHWYGDDAQASILQVPRPSASPDHPTMKPVDLVARCLTNSTPPGGRVYDPFGGSGTTLLAAHTLGATGLLLELDPRYVDVICRRYQDLTGEAPVLQRTGQPVDFRPAAG